MVWSWPGPARARCRLRSPSQLWPRQVRPMSAPYRQSSACVQGRSRPIRCAVLRIAARRISVAGLFAGSRGARSRGRCWRRRWRAGRPGARRTEPGTVRDADGLGRGKPAPAPLVGLEHLAVPAARPGRDAAPEGPGPAGRDADGGPVRGDVAELQQAEERWPVVEVHRQRGRGGRVGADRRLQRPGDLGGGIAGQPGGGLRAERAGPPGQHDRADEQRGLHRAQPHQGGGAARRRADRAVAQPAGRRRLEPGGDLAVARVAGSAVGVQPGVGGLGGVVVQAGDLSELGAGQVAAGCQEGGEVRGGQRRPVTTAGPLGTPPGRLRAPVRNGVTAANRPAGEGRTHDRCIGD